MSVTDGDRLFVHANAFAPAEWAYVLGRMEAVRSLQATAARFTFCGHVHDPKLFHLTGTGKIGDFVPSAGHADPAVGAAPLAGHPRLGRPAARRQPGRLLRHLRHRERRPSPTTACPTTPRRRGAKIRAAGLPQRLADAPGPWRVSRRGHGASARSSAGQVIDGFRLEERLHQGGMAHLWRVTRVDGERRQLPLIMKVPRIKGGDDPATIVGFEVEQMIMPALTRPARAALRRQGRLHAPALHRDGAHRRAPRCARASTHAPLPLDEVVEIGCKVATALHDLHRQHVMHLDVKPSNIMFRDPTATAVLVDFGLSRHDQLPDLLDEEFELPMGTGPYMSPEQVQFVRNDPRSDLFALGVMLYHLATGERPFGAPSTRARPAPAPVPRAGAAARAAAATCPPWLQEIILRCLEVQPDAAPPERRAARASSCSTPTRCALTERAERAAAQRRAGERCKRWFARHRRRAAQRRAGAAGADRAQPDPARRGRRRRRRRRRCSRRCATPCSACCRPSPARGWPA